MPLDPLTIEFLRAYQRNKNVQPHIWKTEKKRKYRITWSDGVSRTFTAGSTYEARVTRLLSDTIRSLISYCEEIEK